jgi:hypothetical protein
MSSPELLFKPPCFQLKDSEYKELVSMPLDQYFQWRQQKLWDFKAQFDGSISGTWQRDQEPERTVTAVLESETIRVRNDDRENYFPQEKCGKWIAQKSDAFNPEKEFGKIPDSDLVKMRHNPCFRCSFTAFCNITITVSNYPYGYRYSESPSADKPPAPSCDWQQWNPKDYYVSNENQEVIWFIDGKLSVAAFFTMSFDDSAKIEENLETVYIRPILAGDYKQSELGAYPVYVRNAKSTLKANYATPISLPSVSNPQNNLNGSFTWSLKADREL